MEDPNNEQQNKALNGKDVMFALNQYLLVITVPSIGASPEEIIKAAQLQQENPRDYSFRPQLMTYDPHCYECKVKYRDPKPKDLVMFLHALKYSVSLVLTGIGTRLRLRSLQGPGWHYETKLPYWATENWTEEDAP